MGLEQRANSARGLGRTVSVTSSLRVKGSAEQRNQLSAALMRLPSGRVGGGPFVLTEITGPSDLVFYNDSNISINPACLSKDLKTATLVMERSWVFL